MKLCFAEFTFDSDALELRRDDEEIRMQPKVLGFLGHLLTNPDRTVTKAELLDALWPGVSVGEDSLSRVASLARRALGDGPERRILQTRRGLGYRIAVPVRAEAAPDAPVRSRPTPKQDSRPALAVLPFENASADADHEYFADGLAEDLITRLSRANTFPVIARASSFRQRGPSLDLAQTGEALGASYLVFGSVRRDAERVRVTAHLVEAATGLDLWSDRYDQPLGEVFAAQDALSQAIVARIVPSVYQVEQRKALLQEPAELDAWEALLRGRWHGDRYTPEDRAKAEELMRRATELDPQSAAAWSGLAAMIFTGIYYGWTGEPQARMREALEVARRAVAAGSSHSRAWFAVAWGQLFLGEHEPARAAAERAVELNASNSAAHWALGVALIGLGAPEAGAAEIEEAIRLSPLDPALRFYYQNLGIAQLMSGRYDEAAESARRSLTQNAEQPAPHRLLAACHGYRGRVEEAREAMAEAIRLAPDFTLEELERVNHPAIVARLMEGWTKAGAALGPSEVALGDPRRS